MTRKKFSPEQNDLPENLTKQLEKKSEVLRRKLVKVFVEGGGTLNVSECLVGWYKIHGEVMSRRNMNAVLHRAKITGLLRSTDKKGEFVIKKRVSQ